jgi:serine/threonine-protein kinase
MGEPADAAPRIVGRYAIFDEIASGGMATVYLGRLMGSGGFARTVAIKRLHPQYAKNPEFVAMFLDEARLAARIRHPNVVPTFDVVAADGELFHVMEYVQGESLSHLARGLRTSGERVPLPILIRVMNDVLQGLHAAHEARDERGVPLNIVHRDVTPQNVLVGVDGVARLLDFGVAKAAGRAQTTQDGQIKGKLAYMAPEQLMSAGVTRETDLYAASVVLWEMLVGERLFSGDNELDVVAKLLQRNVEPPSKLVPSVPTALDDLVMRGLSAKMGDRFATARDMAIALAACGVREATSLEVGEWVEGLAADALADRMARVSAIEQQSEEHIAASMIMRAASSVRPPIDAAHPTRNSVRVSAMQPPEIPSDPLSVTLSAHVFRRRARYRTGIVAVALGLVATAVLAVVTVHFRGAASSAELRLPRPNQGLDEPLHGAPLSAVVNTPPALLVPPGGERLSKDEPSPAPPVSIRVEASAPPPRRRAAPPPPNRRRVETEDRVFESRE